MCKSDAEIAYQMMKRANRKRGKVYTEAEARYWETKAMNSNGTPDNFYPPGYSDNRD